MSKSWRPVAATFVHLLVCCSLAAAQQGNETAAPDSVVAPAKKASQPPVARIEESRPSVYYLPDKQGNLQPVLDFQYQDFVELYKLKNGLRQPDEPPRYSLQRIDAAGAAGEKHAELDIQFQVLVRDDDWVRIPLRLNRALLRSAVKHKGPGEQFVHYESDREGYVCWVRGKSDAPHEIAMTVLVPLATIGDETQLKLLAPRAASSELKLTVPMPNAVVRVSEGATLLPSSADADDSTDFHVAGLGGDFLLAWRKSNPRVVATPPMLEAIGTVLARLDSHSISAEATLSVRGYGAAFDRFIVRLPPGMELLPGESNGYAVVPTVTEAEKEEQPSQATVHLSEETVGPIDVRLACRRDYDPMKNQQWCELAGFEVVGAARQSGTLNVAANGDWQVLWGTSSDVRQIDRPSGFSREKDLVAGFEYFTQPYSLLARLAPRKTHVSVDPRYVLLVERGRIRLEGKLTYRIRGAKTASLDLAIPGWELDEVGPEKLVAVDGVTISDNNMVVPLVEAMSGTVELELRAHRVIEAEAKAIRVVLPRPQVDASGPASVAVVPADNVELTPNSQMIEGLARQRIAPPMRLPERQQDALYYRGAGGEAVFAADFRERPQHIAVEVATQVTLDRHTAEVEQEQSYSIAHEPVDHLRIAVPRALVTNGSIPRILYDSRPLVPVVEADEGVGEGSAAPVSLRVALPSPRMGSCKLALRYSIPVAEPTAGQSSKLTVPLPMPEVGELIANSLTIRPVANVRVSLPTDGPWTVAADEARTRAGRTDLRLTSPKAVGRVDLKLQRETEGGAGATVIDRAWVQSWLTSSARQDRAVYQLTTNRKQLEVVLPDGAIADRAAVAVNGERVKSQRPSKGHLLIPLPGKRETRRLVLELQYPFSGPRPARGAIRLAFPRMDPDVWVRRTYWQLVLPANEHVMANPSGWVGEFTWKWHGYFWGRRPLLDQGQLESWVGATPQGPLSEQASVYLFSTLSGVEQAEPFTASRTWIVLWASGVALVAGLLLIYVPASRHPATLLIVGIGLLAIGLIAPEPTLLLAQAAGLGLILALLAGLLERGVTRRFRRMVVHKEPSGIRVDLGSSQTSCPPQLASTETIPAIQPPSTGNANR